MSAEIELQTAIYDRLTNDGTLMGLINGVFDHVPDNQDAPYVVIGDDALDEWATMGTNGDQGVIYVHTWSEAFGLKEAKTIMQRIYLLLHKHSLSVSGYNTAGLLFESGETFKEADNRTHHGVQRFRIWLREQ